MALSPKEALDVLTGLIGFHLRICEPLSLTPMQAIGCSHHDIRSQLFLNPEQRLYSVLERQKQEHLLFLGWHSLRPMVSLLDMDNGCDLTVLLRQRYEQLWRLVTDQLKGEQISHLRVVGFGLSGFLAAWIAYSLRRFELKPAAEVEVVTFAAPYTWQSLAYRFKETRMAISHVQDAWLDFGNLNAYLTNCKYDVGQRLILRPIKKPLPDVDRNTMSWYRHALLEMACDPTDWFNIIGEPTGVLRACDVPQPGQAIYLGPMSSNPRLAVAVQARAEEVKNRMMERIEHRIASAVCGYDRAADFGQQTVYQYSMLQPSTVHPGGVNFGVMGPSAAQPAASIAAAQPILAALVAADPAPDATPVPAAAVLSATSAAEPACGPGTELRELLHEADVKMTPGQCAVLAAGCQVEPVAAAAPEPADATSPASLSPAPHPQLKFALMMNNIIFWVETALVVLGVIGCFLLLFADQVSLLRVVLYSLMRQLLL